jgi:RNA polymerase sigma factor for flagellar operon FliA
MHATFCRVPPTFSPEAGSKSGSIIGSMVKEPTMSRIKAAAVRTVSPSRTRKSPGVPSSSPAVASAVAATPPKPREKRPEELSPAEIWERYRRAPTTELRNFIWQKYIHLVRYIAERTYTRLPDEVDVNDLMSAGQFGLMDAIDGFDPDRGVKFETFCASRIRGAILDELRAMDWVPRLVRSRSAKVAGAANRFAMAEGRMPTEDELSERLGLQGEDFDKVLRDSRAVGTISLSRKCFSSDGNKEVYEIDVIKDESQRNPLVESQRRDVKEMITKGLSRAERLIVILYYYEEMTMKEIGATLDLSESRVSQMHSSILARLKAQMQNKARELEPEEVK